MNAISAVGVGWTFSERNPVVVDVVVLGSVFDARLIFEGKFSLYFGLSVLLSPRGVRPRRWCVNEAN